MSNADDERAGDDKNMDKDEDEDDDNEDVAVQMELVEDREGERSEGDEDVELNGMVMAPMGVGRLQSWCRSVFDTICCTTTAHDIQADTEDEFVSKRVRSIFYLRGGIAHRPTESYHCVMGQDHR
jgi:hypothetical protein